MNFAQFSKTVEAAGLTPVDRGKRHWQIKGGALEVQFWASTRRGPRYYVNQTRRGACGDLAEAIKATREPPPYDPCDPNAPPRMSAKQTKAIKLRLWRRDHRCVWCRHELTLAETTLEHKVPRGRGGSDGTDNLAIACEGCNSSRGHNMPELVEGGRHR